MKALIIVFSGPLAVGKSSIAESLKERFGARHVSTSALLRHRAGANLQRTGLQEFGAALDQNTGGTWIVDELVTEVGNNPQEIIIVDSVRFDGQLQALRAAYGPAVFHVHVTASEGELRRRFEGRKRPGEDASYEDAKAHPLEANIESLGATAHLKLLTDRLSPISCAARIAVAAGLLTTEIEPLVDVIIGAQFGSEGKGNFCAHLATDYDVLIRVGGPNAGHKVPDPPYTFVQLPSGTAANPTAQIIIGAGAVISESQMLKEIADQKLGPDRLSIDPNAMMIEPSDVQQEEGSLDSIGSTKKGVGVATARKILGRDQKEVWLGAAVRRAGDVPAFAAFIRNTKQLLEDAYSRRDRILLEGTQGTGLSIHHGPYPYVTSRETTAAGCLADAGVAPGRVRRVIMVTRPYPIRVGGTSGDLANPIEFETIASRSGVPLKEIEETEVGSVSGKTRRIAEFDWEQVRWAASLNGATDIALAFGDYISVENRLAHRFDQLTPATLEFIAAIEHLTGAPVSMISVRFAADGVLDRRNWS